MNVNLSEDVAFRIFNFLDDDGDSKITLNELIHAFYISVNLKDDPEDSARIYFFYVDRDRVGYLTY